MPGASSNPPFANNIPASPIVEIGWLDSAFQATYAFGQSPGGLAGDIYGPRIVLSILALVWSLAMLGIAGTTGFWRLIGARGVFGLAQAGVYPVLSKVTRAWYPLSVRTTVQGFVTAMGRLGGATASVLIATVLMGMLAMEWETALVVIAIPGIVLAVSVWFVMRDNPRVHPWTNGSEQELVDPVPATPTVVASGEPPIQAVPKPTLETQLRVDVQPVDAAALHFREHVSGSVLRQLAAVVLERWTRLRQ